MRAQQRLFCNFSKQLSHVPLSARLLQAALCGPAAPRCRRAGRGRRRRCCGALLGRSHASGRGSSAAPVCGVQPGGQHAPVQCAHRQEAVDCGPAFPAAPGLAAAAGSGATAGLLGCASRKAAWQGACVQILMLVPLLTWLKCTLLLFTRQTQGLAVWAVPMPRGRTAVGGGARRRCNTPPDSLLRRPAPPSSPAPLKRQQQAQARARHGELSGLKALLLPAPGAGRRGEAAVERPRQRGGAAGRPSCLHSRPPPPPPAPPPHSAPSCRRRRRRRPAQVPASASPTTPTCAGHHGARVCRRAGPVPCGLRRRPGRLLRLARRALGQALLRAQGLCQGQGGDARWLVGAGGCCVVEPLPCWAAGRRRSSGARLGRPQPLPVTANCPRLPRTSRRRLAWRLRQPKPKHIRSRGLLTWAATTLEAPDASVLLFAGVDALMYL